MEQCNSIEISNIPKGAGRDEIYQLCSSFGKISSMKLGQDKGGHCTTKCTVWYEDPADAFECRRNLNGFHIGEEFLRTKNAIVKEKEMAVPTVDIQSNIH
ncbi:DEKNAAC101759 [Brettanomyces naardenensis]|uniref:DEKNAAC101760 n=1 Tax=Brettanomyces naardenensis TaxID=13370 RepID=A0A448YIT2_BRENA|nr:DEKNAAC101759 [Brettanomyces naardenensis]